MRWSWFEVVSLPWNVYLELLVWIEALERDVGGGEIEALEALEGF